MSFDNNDASLPEEYFNKQHSYKDLFGTNTSLQQHWKSFFTSFSNLGVDEIMNRSNDMMRFLKENGVTYNIYGDPSGLNRPWNLDIVPYLISKEEWLTIEAGLVQRANLFDLILKDVYGDQCLIKEGILPMEIIYNHRGFLRECCGIKLPGKHNLVIYAADIARTNNGKIWILNDRTQAPSGSGYSLENRLAMARIVPELFNGLKVRRLSPYYNAMRNALTAMSPHQKIQPRIVILTPGPSNETYFEHSFLSSHLGFTLVQGDDLMVKDNYVWLKTLGGLEKVDVIVRRVDDEYCDPLELKEDSQLGVPGLLQAVRSGNVSIANPLGSSVVENPGLLPFLPAIAKRLLSEDLKLPTIASWWCGQSNELQYVLDHLSSLVIKRIYRESNNRTSVDATLLTIDELTDLRQKIIAQPHLYVGQEKVDFSSTPAMVNGRLELTHALFRSFAVSDNGSYTVMEGGLTRTSIDKNNIIISNQLGGFSKDTWILSGDESSTLSIKKEQEYVHAQSHATKSDILPSRTAENLFWVGRYTERVLGNARFQRTVMQFVEEANKAFIDDDLNLKQSLLRSLTLHTHTYPGFTGTGSEKKMLDPWKELGDILFDNNRAGSLSNNISSFSRAVHTVRDHWSTDTWRVLREMEEAWQSASAATHKGHYKMLNAVDSLITSMMAFVSLNRESISREQGWNLLDAGRKIEQSLHIISMLRSTLVNKRDDHVEFILQEAVLKSNESLVNYRFKYRAHLQLPLVLDLLLLDPNNPRSLVYQVERLKAYISGLPKINAGHSLAEHERLALEAFTMIKLADKDGLSIADKHTYRYKKLDEFLNKMNNLLHNISNVISKTYLNTHKHNNSYSGKVIFIMQYQITHTTEYEYHQSVSLCHNVAKLILRDTANQLCKKTVVKITPHPDITFEYTDFFGNAVIYFAIQQEHKHLKVTVFSQVEKKPATTATLNFYKGTPWEEIKLLVLEPGDDNFDARQFIPETDITKPNEAILKYAQNSFTPNRSMFDAASELMQRICHDFEFKPGFTTVATPLEVVMKERKGVCQDFAHFAIACIRSLGLPVRYVSGYLETMAPSRQRKTDGRRCFTCLVFSFHSKHWLDRF